MQYYGDYLDNALVYIPWSTNNKAGAAINPTVNGTIAIYKDGNLIQKTSANGITDTRSHDGNVGSHLLAIDTANDTGDAGFWAIGSTYSVKLIDATIDAETVTTWLGSFSLENRNMRGTNAAALASVCTELRLAELDAANMPTDVTTIQTTLDAGPNSLNSINSNVQTTGALLQDLPVILQRTTIATLASQTSFTLVTGSPNDNAYIGRTIIIKDAADATQKAVGRVLAYTGSTKTITLAVDPGIFVMAVGDNVGIIASQSVENAASIAALNNISTAQVKTEVDNALDTLIPATPTAGSVNDKLKPLSYTGTDVKATLDAEQVVVATNNDKVGYALTAVDQDTIVNKVHDEPLAGHATAGSAGKALSDIEANADVATSTRATDAGVWANSTRTLTSLGAALVAEIWDALTSGMVTAGSIGKKLAGLVLGTDSRVLVSIDENVKADVKAINGSTTAAAKLAKSADLILDVTVIAGFTPTTTQFKTNLTSLQVNNYIGRVATFYVGTINEQSAKIEAWDGAGLITVGALTSAPAISDTFLIH